MTTSEHHWLPDHQLDVAATLSHAEELVDQVSDLLFAYQTQPDSIFELLGGRLELEGTSGIL